MQKKLLVVALGTLFSVPVLAADASAAAPAAPAAPTLSAVLDASGITATGYVDVGYTSINGTGLFGDGATPARVFDAPNAATGKNFSSFNLNQAAVTIAKAPKEGFGGLVNITAGEDANVIASYGAGNAGGTPYANNHHVDLTQAYASYTSGSVTAIAGKFATLAGAEVIAGPSNTNISRSILFGYAIPFTHTGVRVTDAVSDTVSVIVGVNNGWDQVADTNTDKTIELGLTANPSKMFSLAASYYGGKELAGGFTSAQTTNGNRGLFDVVGTFNATDSLTFILNYDNGSQDNATLASGATGKGTWNGLAAYANYQINAQNRVSLRSEYLSDKDGVRLPYVPSLKAGQRWKETTLTYAYMPTANAELRAEIRGDSSDQNVFLSSDGTTKSSQSSFGLEAIYKF
jgi:Putative beta-barrel porin-2, OmpL-like. bbp2